jgi:hypothetical protein
MKLTIRSRTLAVASMVVSCLAWAPGQALAGPSAVDGAHAGLPNSGLTFPGQTLGTTSAEQSIVLSNDGPATVSISHDSLSGSGAGAFPKTSDSCQGTTLIAGASCTIAYAFAPLALGEASATLTIASNAQPPLPRFSLTGTGVPPTMAGSLPTAAPPSLSGLTLSASTFRPAGSGPDALAASAAPGTFVIYTDSQAATTTFLVERRSRTGYKLLGSFTHADSAGTNALRFTGRLAGRPLASGRYRLTASAESAAGRSAPVSAAFAIAR